MLFLCLSSWFRDKWSHDNLPKWYAYIQIFGRLSPCQNFEFPAAEPRFPGWLRELHTVRVPAHASCLFWTQIPSWSHVSTPQFSNFYRIPVELKQGASWKTWKKHSPTYLGCTAHRSSFVPFIVHPNLFGLFLTDSHVYRCLCECVWCYHAMLRQK